MENAFGGSPNSSYPGSPTRRQSSFAWAAQSFRASTVGRAVTVVEEHIEVGTVGGTALNTTCNVIGAGVLALPLVAYNGSLALTMVLILALGTIGAFAAYVCVVGCDRTGAFFLNEVFAIAVVGRPPSPEEEEQQQQRQDSSLLSPLVVTKSPPTSPPTSGTSAAFDNLVAEAEQRNVNRRTKLSLMVDACVFTNNYGILIVYTRIIVDSIPSVLKNFFGASGWIVADYTWLLFAAAVFLPLTAVRNMEELKWSSILGVATIMYAALSVVVRYATDGYQGGGEPDYHWVELTPHFPQAVATLAVAFGYHYNAPVFYGELEGRSPRKFMHTVAIAFPIITVTYLVVAIFGYLSFAHHVADADANGEILNNYRQNDIFINTVRLGMFFHFACVYPVLSVSVRHSLHRFQLTVRGRRAEAVDPETPAKVPRGVLIAEAILIVCSSAGIAFVYKNVGQLMGILGALCGANLMLTIPGVIGMCIWTSRPEVKVDTTRLLQRVVSGYGAAEAEGSRSASFQNNSDLAWGLGQHPPPLWHRRQLMFGLCAGMTVFGVITTVAGVFTAFTS